MVKIFCLFSLFAFAALGIFSGIVIYNAPLEKMERIQTGEVDLERSTFEKLEEGSLVDKDLLKTYLLFSKNKKRVSNWFEKKIEEEELEIIKNNQVLIKKEILLPYLRKNDCELLYCLQYRIPFEKMPALFWRGLIGIEDYRFLEHPGVDVKSILRAVVTDIKKMKLEQGGSTLTMQLVKNLFYSNEKKFSRKIKEMILSIYLETIYEKENIIEAYLNEVNWGSIQGVKIKGIGAASFLYFGKSPGDISPFEASILIGLLKGPYYYSPINKIERLKERALIVFHQLVKIGQISSKEKVWTPSKWKKWSEKIQIKNKNHDLLSFWKASKNKESYLSFFEKFTFNEKAKSLLSSIKKKVGDRDISIKAVFGSLKKEETYEFYSKFERRKERAISEEFHQIGSTLKPLLYSFFLNQFKNPDDLISTAPIPMKLISGRWSPKEAHKKLPEEVTVEEALLNSYNRPVIRLAKEYGLERLEEDLSHFVPRLKVPLKEYPAQLLGAVELSVKELFHLYKNFFIRECRSLEPRVIRILSDPQKTTIRNLVGQRLSELKFFGKTGTSNKGHDNWFISFDGDEIGVIWVGLEGNRIGPSLPLYGSSTAFKLFKNFSELRGKRFNELICEGKIEER